MLKAGSWCFLGQSNIMFYTDIMLFIRVPYFDITFILFCFLFYQRILCNSFHKQIWRLTTPSLLRTQTTSPYKRATCSQQPHSNGHLPSTSHQLTNPPNRTSMRRWMHSRKPTTKLYHNVENRILYIAIPNLIAKDCPTLWVLSKTVKRTFFVNSYDIEPLRKVSQKSVQPTFIIILSI